MRRALAITLAALPFMQLHAEPPVVGLWEDAMIVNDDTEQLIAHQNFIFTNKKLSRPTRFSAIMDFHGEIDFYCCVDVKNTHPISAKALLRQFSRDRSFVSRLTHIEGLNYIYAAELANERIQNDNMRILENPQTKKYYIPFSAAAIGAEMDVLSIAGNEFKVKNHFIQFTTTAPDHNHQSIVHTFKIDGTHVVIVVPLEPH
jgi:hypothetical protein